MKALAGYRGVLEVREARVLIGASAVSQVGDWLYNAALLGYVFHATHSAVRVGAATICRLLPYVLLAPLGCAVADRYPRRTVLVVGSLLRLAIMLVLAAVLARHGPVALTIGMVAASAAGSAERPAALSLLDLDHEFGKRSLSHRWDIHCLRSSHTPLAGHRSRHRLACASTSTSASFRARLSDAPRA